MTERISIRRVAELLGKKDNRTAVNWCRKNKVVVLYDSSNKEPYVIKQEFEMKNSRISIVEKLNIKNELRNIDRQIEYFKTNSNWQPCRYTVFIKKMEQILETLKKIIYKTSRERKDEELQKFKNHASVLLNEYSIIWEQDYK